MITIDPGEEELLLQFRGGKAEAARVTADLKAGETYPFTYIQEDSVGIFYLDGLTAFTVRMYGISDKPMYLFAKGSQVTFSGLELQTR